MIKRKVKKVCKKKKIIKVICLNCGKDINSYKSLKRKFCCLSCFHESLRKKGSYRKKFIEKISKGIKKGRRANSKIKL